MAWQELGKTWHDTNVEYCDVCGNLLIRRAWVFTAGDGRTLRACREDDERLWATLGSMRPAIEAARRVYEERQKEGTTP
jgi:NMD protein affecting ribosome stability and mRNA decay